MLKYMLACIMLFGLSFFFSACDSKGSGQNSEIQQANDELENR